MREEWRGSGDGSGQEMEGGGGGGKVSLAYTEITGRDMGSRSTYTHGLAHLACSPVQW